MKNCSRSRSPISGSSASTSWSWPVSSPSLAAIYGYEHRVAVQISPGNLGALKVGKAADLVMVDWDALAYPYLDPPVAPLDGLAARAALLQLKAPDGSRPPQGCTNGGRGPRREQMSPLVQEDA
jgi:hypothetical protein